MNTIIDTAMLKHHRVEYGDRIDTDGAKRPTNTTRLFAPVLVAVIAVSVFSNLIA